MLGCRFCEALRSRRRGADEFLVRPEVGHEYTITVLDLGGIREVIWTIAAEYVLRLDVVYFLFFKLNNSWVWALLTGLTITSLPLALSTEGLDFTPLLGLALATLGWAAGELEPAGLPVDLGVVVLQPPMPKDERLFPQLGDGKHNAFRVTFMPKNNIYHRTDTASLVGRTINVEDRYRTL